MPFSASRKFTMAINASFAMFWASVVSGQFFPDDPSVKLTFTLFSIILFIFAIIKMYHFSVEDSLENADRWKKKPLQSISKWGLFVSQALTVLVLLALFLFDKYIGISVKQAAAVTLAVYMAPIHVGIFMQALKD